MVGKDIKTAWEEYEKSLQGTGFFGTPQKVDIHIENAKALLVSGLRYYCGESAVWQPEYDGVAEWLTDNKGRTVSFKNAVVILTSNVARR